MLTRINVALKTLALIPAFTLTSGAAYGELEQRVDVRVGADAVSFGPLELNTLASRARSAADGPLQVAVSQDVALSPRDVGTLEQTADGRVVWRYRLDSANAEHINVAFEWNVPSSTRMYLLDGNGRTPYRAFTSQDNMTHRELWTPWIQGSSMELYAEVDAQEIDAFLDGVAIFEVNLGFMPIGSATNAFTTRSNSCHVDVACPEGDPWGEQISGVTTYLINGNGVCSGSLVNNTNQDGTPLLLTAFHCVGSDSSFPTNEPSLVAIWNFQNSTCRPPGSSQSGNNGNGSTSQFTSGGAVLRSAISTADVVVFQLNQAVDPAFNVHYLGWDRGSSAPGRTVGIHHPSGEEKRISIDDDAPFSQPNINLSNQLAIRTWAVDYDEGGLEGGSSGSPLFNQTTGRIIGVGTAVSTTASSQICTTQDQFYGRLNYAWTRGAPQTVGAVLDPAGSGSAQTLGILGGSSALPGSFGAVFPADSSTEVARNLTFEWEFSPLATTYDFAIYSDAAGTQTVFSADGLTTNSTAPTLNLLQSFTDYWWTVDAINANGTVQITGGLQKFSTITTGPPAASVLLTPADGDTDVPVDVVFAWEPANGADFYQLRINNIDTGEIIYSPTDGDIFATSFQLPLDLPTNTQISWGVINRNSNGVSLSTPLLNTFTTEGDTVPECPEDIDMSGGIDITDLLALLSVFDESTSGPFQGGDITGDGIADISDLLALLAKFDTACQ